MSRGKRKNEDEIGVDQVPTSRGTKTPKGKETLSEGSRSIRAETSRVKSRPAECPQPLQQAKAWQKLQEDLGEKCFFREGNGYHFLAIKKKTPAGSYLYLPYGPVAEDEKAFRTALAELENLARDEKAIFIRIEPQMKGYSLPKNAKKSKDLNPADTWILDLTPEKAEIITGFSQGTRTRYNTYAKKGIAVEATHDPEKIQELVRLQSALAAKKGINTFAENYLKAELEQPFATLYLIKYQEQKTSDQASEGVASQSQVNNSTLENQVSENAAKNQTGKNSATNQRLTKKPTPRDGEVIAASLFFDDETTRYYMQSATNDKYRHLPATVALLTAALFDAKDKGLHYFDFWGIAPENAEKDHPWQGFTEFKKSFGGEAKHYQGTYDLPVNQLKYRVYQILRKINRLRRRI